MKPELQAFERLLDIMDVLRDQCPWDRKQTLESLRTLSIEEVYELADAIADKDLPEIKKELGDIIMHVVFYAKIGKEQEAFDITDVIQGVCDKLEYRHPHIFGDVKVKSAQDVEENWERLKLKEEDGNKRVLGGIPRSLPALIKAHRLQDKARGVGFDWEQKEQIWGKIDEEMEELKEELRQADHDRAEAEFGDFLFSVINAARLYGINPENALERTNKKFIYRFNYLEDKTIRKGKDLNDMSLEEMDAIWNEAKRGNGED